MNVTITIDMDKACAECGNGGAADNGLCLKCTGRAFRDAPMKSRIGRAVQKRIRSTKSEGRR